MARVIALVRTPARSPHFTADLGVLRFAIVGGCALALMAAGQALPF